MARPPGLVSWLFPCSVLAYQSRATDLADPTQRLSTSPSRPLVLSSSHPLSVCSHLPRAESRVPTTIPIAYTPSQRIYKSSSFPGLHPCTCSTFRTGQLVKSSRLAEGRVRLPLFKAGKKKKASYYGTVRYCLWSSVYSLIVVMATLIKCTSVCGQPLLYLTPSTGLTLPINRSVIVRQWSTKKG